MARRSRAQATSRSSSSPGSRGIPCRSASSTGRGVGGPSPSPSVCVHFQRPEGQACRHPAGRVVDRGAGRVAPEAHNRDVSGPFEPGERVLLVDDRSRTFLVRLQPGATFHFHGGQVPHDLVLGSEEGTEVHSTMGTRLACWRPTLADFVLKMPRGAQVIYPKDIGAIVVEADIAPGSSVLEAGTGSGALTIALSRAAGSDGRVVSYEAREDFHEKAAANLEAFF